MSRGRKRIEWTPEMDATLIALRQRWPGRREAARRIGVAEMTMRDRMKVLGLPLLRRKKQ